MNISRRFIEYPVMTTLLMAALVIFGIAGYLKLPTSELPNVDFPTVQVSASLAGADPETMASAIAAPLENAFSNVPGIDSMSSQSTLGQTSIVLQFKLDRNIDAAAQDVQAALSVATRQLPKTMINPPSYRKVNPSDQPIFFLVLTSKTLPVTTVERYADMLARQLSTLDGVAQVPVSGAAKYAVRVQADPNALAVRGIGIDTLATAINDANVNQATGTLNGASDAQIIRTDGQLDSAKKFRDQIIAYSNGAPVRLGDVATVLDSSANVRQADWYRTQRAVSIFVQRQPGANTIEVVKAVRAILPQFKASLPAGIDLEVRHDRSESIRASVANVQETLLIAAALVVGVIFVFLRKVSATIIPALALPIAVIGTFAGMSLMGFNLDNLSLMALTLSVGFVVDDAIVMLENIVRHIEQGEKPYEAALKGSGEIAFTILSMTISLAAVFIPIVFMSGLVGRLLYEFSVTIILAIFFSGIVSITLTPMLCARLLRDESHEKHNKFYKWSEDSFNWVQDRYNRSLAWSMRHKGFILSLFFLSIAASVGLFKIMPQDFLPPDDQGQLRATLQAANGTSYERMVAYGTEANAIVNADPNVAGSMLDVTSSGAGANSASLNIMLKTLGSGKGERKLMADQVAPILRRKLGNLTGLSVFVSNPPTINIGGRGSRSNYQYTLQGPDLGQLQDVSSQLEDELKSMPGFVGVNSDFDKATPATQVHINRDRAAALKVSPSQIENAMGYAFGGQQVSQIFAASDQYPVMLELLPSYQRNATALRSLYITSKNGTLVPLSAVTDAAIGSMPLSVNHSGQLPSVTVSFDLAEGYSLSDAVAGIQKASDAIGMPETVQGSFQGTADAFQQSIASMGELLLIAIMTVYIILGILYESFIHPLTILSGLPSAAVGALLTLYIAGLPLTIYAFVGMMMLVGIVKKNAIMMIDFALHKQRSEAGIPAAEAILEAARIRFRPIMMTTMAAMMGTLPIAFGSGIGSESRRPLGLCVAGGLLFSQLLTLYITPVIYTYMDRLEHLRLFGPRRKNPSQAAPAE